MTEQEHRKMRENYERNVKDVGLLGEFSGNYRLPHVDRNGATLKPGDEVFAGCGGCGDTGENGVCECKPCNRPWVVGERFLVLKCGVKSRAREVEGHLLQAHDCITVVAIENVLKVKP